MMCNKADVIQPHGAMAWCHPLLGIRVCVLPINWLMPVAMSQIHATCDCILLTVRFMIAKRVT